MWTDDWLDYSNHSYKFFSDKNIIGTSAVTECKERGALLVSINSPEEQEFLAERVLQKRTLSAYTGASDVDTGEVIDLDYLFLSIEFVFVLALYFVSNLIQLFYQYVHNRYFFHK